jgi:ribosomal protein S18 acetylase RimI-like enzyme
MSYTHTLVTTTSHLQDVLAFVARMATQQWPLAMALPGDLDWWRRADFIAPTPSHIQLWHCDHHLVAVLWPTDDQIDIIYDDAVPQLWSDIVAYCSQHHAPTCKLWTLSGQQTRAHVLRQHGYRPQPTELLVHHQDTRWAPLHHPPAGIRIGAVTDALVDSRAAAQRDAFQSTKMSPTIYQHVRQLPSYTPAYDTVAINDADEVVAFATVWVDWGSGTALFEPVGCRHAYQRHGITKALISNVLQQLHNARIFRARVLSEANPDNPAIRLYHRCGFITSAELIPWQRV